MGVLYSVCIVYCIMYNVYSYYWIVYCMFFQEILIFPRSSLTTEYTPLISPMLSPKKGIVFTKFLIFPYLTYVPPPPVNKLYIHMKVNSISTLTYILFQNYSIQVVS